MKKINFTKDKTDYIIAKSNRPDDSSFALIDVGKQYLDDFTACHEASLILGKKSMNNIIEFWDRNYIAFIPGTLTTAENFIGEYAASSVGDYAFVDMKKSQFDEIKKYCAERYETSYTILRCFGDLSFNFSVSLKDIDSGEEIRFETETFDMSAFY